jgi:hypothetical protein
LDPEKCQLIAVMLLGITFEIAGVVPPFGAKTRVRTVIGGKFEIAGALDG